MVTKRKSVAKFTATQTQDKKKKKKNISHKNAKSNKNSWSHKDLAICNQHEDKF